MTIRRVFVTAVCLLLIPVLTVAERSVPTDVLREKFFATLNDRQMVEFMQALDKSKQLSTYELGAKYRWGYIPPDRTPPASVAQWWKSLSPRQRDRQRLKWFKNHFQQLSPDRVARQLEIQNQLTEIYRELRADYSKTPDALESVPFPDSKVEPTKANRDATEFETIYEQSNNPEENTTDEMDQRPEYLPGDTATETVRDGTSSGKPGEQPSESSSNQNQASSQDDQSSEQSPETENQASDQKNSDAESGEPEEFASGDLLYRRVGDHIEVIGRTESADRSGDTMPSVDFDTSPAELSPDTSPGISKRSEGVNIPLPALRNQEQTGSDDNHPELRGPR